VLEEYWAWGPMAAVKESACSSLSHVGQILFEYLSELSRTELDLLYADAPSVRVIFREAVPPVAQQLVMRLLLGGARPFQESVLKRWCATLSALPHTAYLSVLQRLQILLPQKAQKPGQAPPGQLLMLHKTFQSSLSAYLQGAQEGQLLREPTCPGSSSKDADVLLRYALASWESFLGELLDPGSQSLLADLASVLNFKDGSGGLTAAGFQFVLDERQQQLWRLVISFLKKDGAAETGADGRQRALQALLAIGELGLGERLASSAPRPFLRFLVDLGVLYEAGEAGTGEGAGTGSLLITPAALALFRRDVSQRLSRSAGSEAGESQGLIVESNFKVYGYISSPLQALLLGHFCEILVRLPNLVVGQLTAESVLKAMSQGIRAAHMLRYLEAAAHPQQRLREGESGEGSVPSNVCGQLEAPKPPKPPKPFRGCDRLGLGPTIPPSSLFTCAGLGVQSIPGRVLVGGALRVERGGLRGHVRRGQEAGPGSRTERSRKTSSVQRVRSLLCFFSSRTSL